MPMSPRLLRPIASRSLVDADATAYLTAVQAADGQALEPLVREAITAFVVGCKADGIWSAIKASCILMGARTLSGALTPLVGAAPTPFNFAAGDYNRKTGLVGNGTTKYLNTGRANNADGQDNKHGSVWISQHHNPITTFACPMGAGSNGSGAFNLATATGFRVRFHSSGLTFPTGDPTPQTGLFGASRSASGTFVLRANGSDTTISNPSGAPSSDNLLVFVRGVNNATDVNTWFNGRLAFYSIGTNLALASLDSRVATLYNAIGAAVP
jgi:hypothetical protein